MELGLEDFDLEALINDMSAMFSIRCQQNNIEWNSSYDLKNMYTKGDASKLRQILINLLGNAVKFTERGGNVSLLVTQPENEFIFKVSDTGMGISEDGLKTLFQPFKQDVAGKTKGGTGLGLTISREQLALMGSDLKVTSVLGEGSTFTFALKLELVDSFKKPCSDQRKYTDILGINGSSPLILIVDDVMENRDILTEFLNKIGFRTDIAINGEAAIEKAYEKKPDLILMDIKMPVMSGTDAMKRIREDDSFNNVPIVALTASSLAAQKSEFLKAGFDQFIGKPFIFEDILCYLSKALNIEYKFKDIDVEHSNEQEHVETNIPDDIIETLLSYAEDGVATDIKETIETLIENYPIFSQNVTEFVDEYDFDGLVDFLESIKAC